MDETSFLLPARACSSSSSSGAVQPDRRVLANESGSSSSRLPETGSPPRYRGLREIAHLFRDSIPGPSSSPSSSSPPFSCHHLVIFSYTLQLSLQTVSVTVVARLGSTALSVSAFSLMLAFVTGSTGSFHSQALPHICSPFFCNVQDGVLPSAARRPWTL